jgi:hypothetical protein
MIVLITAHYAYPTPNVKRNNLRSMKLFVAWGSKQYEQDIERATLVEDAPALARFSQAVSQATEFWKSWAFAIGGEIVQLDGVAGMAKVPADALDELPAIREKYALRIGVSVSVGVGAKATEADKARRVAELRGSDRIVLYSPDVDYELEKAKAKPRDGVDALAEMEYFGKNTDWHSHDLHDDLRAAVVAESGFAQPNHPNNSPAAYHAAFGPAGLKPSTAQEEYNRNLKLQRLFPNLHETKQFHSALRRNPTFYNHVASAHWQRLKESVGGDLARAAYGWRWGKNLAAGSSHEDVNNDPYVQKFMEAHNKMRKMEIEQLLVPLRKGSVSPAGPELLTAKLPRPQTQPALVQGGGGGMTGNNRPNVPAAPRGEGSEHSEAEVAADQAEQAISPETTHAADNLQDQMGAMAQDGEDEDQSQANQVTADDKRSQIKQQIIQVLEEFKQQAPYLEQIKEQNPELYQSMLAVVQSMVSMGKQLMGDQDGDLAETPDEEDDKESSSPAESEGSDSTEKAEMKAELPMPHAPTHPHLNLPVGTLKDGVGKIKVRHDDDKEGWVEARAGQVLSRDGHPISALNPGGH